MKKNTVLPPPVERRPLRRALNRRISIGLAILTVLFIGISAWIIATRKPLPPVETAPLASETTSKRNTDSEPEDTKNLISHKALYSVSLVGSKNGSQIIDINGKMFFQIQNGCHGFVTDHRFTLNYNYADSEPLRITSDFSTVESKGGQTFDFSARRRRNGDLYEEIRGKAEINETSGKIDYTEPETQTLPLSPGTLFPAAHTRALIDAARSGKRFLTSTVFDGSDTEGPADVTTIITARPLTPKLSTKSNTSTQMDTSILSGRAWKIRLAFFPKNAPSETSDYELSMILYENGVISEMTIDYPDFTVLQKLIALEELTPDICDNNITPKASPLNGNNTKKETPQPIPNLPLR